MSSRSEPATPENAMSGTDALGVFQRCLDWLKQHYGDYEFFLERDIVWTCQQWLRKEYKEGRSPFRAFYEWPIVFGDGRRTWADLVMLDEKSKLCLAVEFKCEPDHWRARDFQPGKLAGDVVDWGSEGMMKAIGTSTSEWCPRG